MKSNKNYRFEKIEAVRNDGKIVRGRLYLPLDENGKYRTAIFAHGFGGCYRDLMHYGPRFAEAGLALCVFDFCGGGPLSSSDGTMMDMSVLTEYDDYLAVLNKVREHPQVDDRYIYLMGESQGGYVASMVGADLPEYTKGMILWYPSVWMLPKVIEYAGLTDHYPGIMELYEGWKSEYAAKDEPSGKTVLLDAGTENKSSGKISDIKMTEDISDVINIWGQQLSRKYIDDMAEIDMEKVVSSYPGKVLILQGDKDDIVPLEITYKTVKTFPHAELRVIEGGGHGFEEDCSIQAGNYAIEYMKK